MSGYTDALRLIKKRDMLWPLGYASIFVFFPYVFIFNQKYMQVLNVFDLCVSCFCLQCIHIYIYTPYTIHHYTCWNKKHVQPTMARWPPFSPSFNCSKISLGSVMRQFSDRSRCCSWRRVPKLFGSTSGFVLFCNPPNRYIFKVGPRKKELRISWLIKIYNI